MNTAVKIAVAYRVRQNTNSLRTNSSGTTKPMVRLLLSVPYLLSSSPLSLLVCTFVADVVYRYWQPNSAIGCGRFCFVLGRTTASDAASRYVSHLDLSFSHLLHLINYVYFLNRFRDFLLILFKIMINLTGDGRSDAGTQRSDMSVAESVISRATARKGKF